MLFTPYKPHVGPHELEAAQAAFDMAWAELSWPDDVDDQTVRDRLAKRIIDGVVENGERDPERLKAYALAGFKP